jgi:hypothetical protein
VLRACVRARACVCVSYNRVAAEKTAIAQVRRKGVLLSLGLPTKAGLNNTQTPTITISPAADQPRCCVKEGGPWPAHQADAFAFAFFTRRLLVRAEARALAAFCTQHEVLRPGTPN